MTGAGSGIGRASAVGLARKGAQLALTDSMRRSLPTGGGRRSGAVVVQVAGDIVVRATIDQLAGAAMDDFGRIDVLDNNVGILVVKPLADHTLEDFDRLMHVNCWSYVLTTQRVVPEMRKTGGGSIINISSVGGLIALPKEAAYCASKGAVIGLTRSIAYELAPDIRCNVICPGGVETPMSESPRRDVRRSRRSHPADDRPATAEALREAGRDRKRRRVSRERRVVVHDSSSGPGRGWAHGVVNAGARGRRRRVRAAAGAITGGPSGGHGVSSCSTLVADRGRRKTRREHGHGEC